MVNVKQLRVDRMLFILLSLVLSPFVIFSQEVGCTGMASTATFNMDECDSYVIAETNKDYSEFTADILLEETCPTISILGGHFYRNSSHINPHSCTPGLNETEAICVSSSTDCEYDTLSTKPIVIDFQITPGNDGIGRFSGFSFYEQGPAEFNWIAGDSGPNNYPTLFGYRIYKEEVEIFNSYDIPTNLTWTAHSFCFGGDPEFEVSDTTDFKIEIMAYCPIGNGSPVYAWDLENLVLEAGCTIPVEGGSVSIVGSNSTTFEVCSGDGEADALNLNVVNPEGDFMTWIVTDENGEIQELVSDPNFDFEGVPAGTCYIYHLSYNSITGLAVGANVTDLMGLFDLSNEITVIRDEVNGGSITGGPFEVCLDGNPDFLTGIGLTSNVGKNSQWVVTNGTGSTILGLPQNIEDVDFDDVDPGICLIWHLSYADGLTGLELNASVSALEGCYDLSNSIQVVRSEVEAGMIVGGPYDFCVGNGEGDFAADLQAFGAAGQNTEWIITDGDGIEIIALTDDITTFDFDGAGSGICLIWHIAYNDGLTGLVQGGMVADISGCFDLSNSVIVNRANVDGGTLVGGPFAFCIDGEADFISGIELIDAEGDSTAWIITNSDTTSIIGIPGDPLSVDFDAAGPGVCLLWHLSYSGPITGLALNGSPADLDGCLNLSNAIIIDRNGPNGGTLEGGPFTFCVGDGVADNPTGVTLVGNSGTNNDWIITNEDGSMILALPDTLGTFDFDGAGLGVCLIWNISYEGEVEGLEVGGSPSLINGCFSLSSSITVTRTEATGGELTGGPFEFCAGDSESDFVSGITLTGNAGDSTQWVITDENLTILDLPDDLEIVDFNDAGNGTCLIWSISFAEGLIGLEMDSNVNDLQGCFALSNSVTVVRNEPDGGELTGGPYVFCVDGEPDFIVDIELNGNEGPNSSWVITDDTGELILGVPSSPTIVDFDLAGPGNCLVWHVSYSDIDGLAANGMISDITGCFSFSNPLTVVRSQADGGSITGGPFTFCVGDGVADNVSGVTVSGNSGTNSQWVVTDGDTTTILGLPTAPELVDFDGTEVGTCLIWHMSYEDGTTGIEVDSLVANITGCFDLSNAVVVNRAQPQAGDITGGPFEFCVDDGIPDMATGVEVMGNMGTNSQWVITDDQGDLIIGLPANVELVDFDGAGAGVCRIWHISYEDGLTGLGLNGTISGLDGCFDISNSIVVNRLTGSDCGGNEPTTDIAINEIGSTNFVELVNLSQSTIDVSSYYLCQFPDYAMVGDMNLLCGNDYMMEPGEYIVVILDFNFNSSDGEMGLYTSNLFIDPLAMIDYVEWGFSGHQRSDIAVLAGIWTMGDFVPSYNAANNLNWDGTSDASGAWYEAADSYCDENNVNSPEDDELARVYPNPVSDYIHLEWMIETEEDVKIDIYDALSNRQLSRQITTDNHQVDVSSLESGYYFIRIESGRKSQIKKVLIID